MRKQAEAYAIELVIVAVGLVVALGEAVLVRRGDLAVLLAVVAALISLAVVAIRQELARQLRDGLLEHQIIQAIPDERWQADALRELREARVKFSSWRDGTRRVDEAARLRYQINLLHAARSSVSAIHIANDEASLEMWVDRGKGFARLVDAYRELPPEVVKRRILVLREDDAAICRRDTGGRVVTSDLVKRAVGVQTSPVDDGGLDFDLRVLWIKAGDRRATDTLVVDEVEFCSLQSEGNGQFSDLYTCVSRPLVQAHCRTFEELWDESIPWADCLDKLPSSRKPAARPRP